MSTYNLCFEQKYEKYQSFLCENFQFLEVKFSIYLYRRVFVMGNVVYIFLTFVIIRPTTGFFFFFFFFLIFCECH